MLEIDCVHAQKWKQKSGAGCVFVSSCYMGSIQALKKEENLNVYFLSDRTAKNIYHLQNNKQMDAWTKVYLIELGEQLLCSVRRHENRFC